ncbi:MAG TPA: hypothetical protein VJ011_10615 [Steroidobacteraceae bacterium]|nr:hypothetical protein [Steroidobacteraceae bacterium]
MRTIVLLLVLVIAGVSSGCATSGAPRAATSSAGCVEAAVADIAASTLGDKRAHCLGAARIAARCSVSEAALASYAKEMRDLFTRGDAQLADIRAGRAGIRCARTHAEAADQARCCEASGF